MRQHCVLKIKDANAGDTGPLGEQQQVFRMIVAQHQHCLGSCNFFGEGFECLSECLRAAVWIDL